jgi:hypothetical protein
MKHLSIFQTSFTRNLRQVRSLVATTVVLVAASAMAQVASVAPSVFSLNVATGGTVAGSVAPSPPTAATAPTGTGNRAATASMCSALQAGAGPGVSLTDPCNPATLFSSTIVGAAANVSTTQAFITSYTPAQLAAAVTTLAAAGQPFGSRRFFIVMSFVPSAIAPPSAPRFVALQVNLIEPLPPVLGITNATASLVDVALNAPTPVTVRYTLAGSDTPLAGQFCSALTTAYPASGVATGNPCAPASSLGNVNPAIGFSNAAQTGETLVVPETIARQATQRAQASGNGIFYFVRQFASGKYAVVQLRLNSNAANIPLAFTDIRLGFRDGGSLQNIGFFKRGQVLPAVSAALRYQGAGVLRARWEIVQPGDTPPTALDLQAEAALSPLERAQQHRYRVLERVNIYLPANGQATLSGPVPRLLPNEQYGQYLLLLRIETSDSITGVPAGTAAFTLPVLRYYIGESSGPVASAKAAPEAISLVAPQAGAVLDKDAPLTFQWLENKDVSLYRLEIEANGKQVYAARVRPSAQEGTNRYTAPPFVASILANKAARWRVVALASDGQFVGESEWRDITNAP